MPADPRPAALGAALAAGAEAGFPATRPVVLQDTNNVVVWLAPHEVVAKVGVLAHSAEVLGREVDVCAHLAAAGAPVAAPIDGLFREPVSGLPVSFWVRHEADPGARPRDGELAAMLAAVHAALASCPLPLPRCEVALDLARVVLFDDARMAALAADDRDLLRAAFDDWVHRAGRVPRRNRPIHGEPHPGNVIPTAAGPVLVDFEAVSMGPLEWDLASMPPGVAHGFDDVDRDLLALLRLVASARVATWCWARADDPSMRRHGEHHLRVVRAAFAG